MAFSLVEEEEQPPQSEIGVSPIRQQEPQMPRQEESFLQKTGRGIARTAARVGEQIAGAPGDIFSLINDFIARPVVEKVSGQKGIPYEETYLGKAFPTTAQHRKAIASKTGEYLEPKNKVEATIDNFIQDATALFLPGAKAGQVGKKIGTSLLISAGANAVGETIKDLSGDEKKAAGAKLGSLFLLSMFDKPRAAKFVSSLYKPLEGKLHKLKPMDAFGLEKRLNTLKNKVSKGTLAPSEKFIVDESDAILSKIKNGELTAEEAWASKRSLNEKLSKILYEIPEKTGQQRARKLAAGIQEGLNNFLKQTAAQDPKFYKDLKAADKAFGTVAQSNLVSKFIEKNLKYSPVTSGLLHLFHGPIGSTASTVALPYATGKILYRISKSPQLAKHYSKVLSSAAAEDSIILNHELRKLDKGLQEQQKKDRFSLVNE